MSIRANDETLREAQRLAPLVTGLDPQITEPKEAVRAVLDKVLHDPEVREAFPTGEIQLWTILLIVAQQVLEILGFDRDSIGVMAIGDTEMPKFMNDYMTVVSQKTEENKQAFLQKYGNGYDIYAQGYVEARRSMIEYFDGYYGFSESSVPDLAERLIQNSTLTVGGMLAMNTVIGAINSDVVKRRGKPGIPERIRGIVRDLIIKALGKSGISRRLKKKKLRTRFNFPDNTFAMALEIAGGVLSDDQSEMHQIPTKQRNLLHLTPTEINEFYEREGAGEAQDIWYIIPVGNPSGTAARENDLHGTCKAILHNSPNAVIMMDCAYVRTMSRERSREQFKRIMNDEKILRRIVFVDSFSKSHAMCGARLGTYFALDPKLYMQILAYDRTMGQGRGSDKSAAIKAICDMGMMGFGAEKEAELHRFWRNERLGLWYYLTGNFRNLFHADQSHILMEQLLDLTSIYLTLRLADSVTVAEVASRTGAGGVPPKPMGDGNYVRFSFGTTVKPTYASYILPEVAAELPQ